MVETKERCLVESLERRPLIVRFPTLTLTELTEEVKPRRNVLHEMFNIGVIDELTQVSEKEYVGTSAVKIHDFRMCWELCQPLVRLCFQLGSDF